MSHQATENTGVIKNYTLTALSSFIIIFLLFIAVSGCHGEYHAPSSDTHHNVSSENKSAHH